MRVKDIPPHERPRERAWREGVASLSDTELLAILLRAGRRGKSAVELGTELMHACRGDLTTLAEHINPHESKRMGLGKVQQLTLCAALELGLRRGRTRIQPQTKEEAIEYCVSFLQERTHEKLMVIGLDLRNQCVGFPLEIEGGKTGIMVDARDVLSRILRMDAARIILVHNHPSQDPTPSPQDVLFTKQILEGSQWINVELVDHVIVTREKQTSFRANGWFD